MNLVKLSKFFLGLLALKHIVLYVNAIINLHGTIWEININSIGQSLSNSLNFGQSYSVIPCYIIVLARHFIFYHGIKTAVTYPIWFTSSAFITNVSLILRYLWFNSNALKFEFPANVPKLIRTFLEILKWVCRDQSYKTFEHY